MTGENGSSRRETYPIITSFTKSPTADYSLDATVRGWQQNVAKILKISLIRLQFEVFLAMEIYFGVRCRLVQHVGTVFRGKTVTLLSVPLRKKKYVHFETPSSLPDCSVISRSIKQQDFHSLRHER